MEERSITRIESGLMEDHDGVRRQTLHAQLDSMERNCTLYALRGCLTEEEQLRIQLMAQAILSARTVIEQTGERFSLLQTMRR